ncbi:PRC-barrel domain-containing protein [Roseivivax sp. CAU 1753]
MKRLTTSILALTLAAGTAMAESHTNLEEAEQNLENAAESTGNAVENTAEATGNAASDAADATKKVLNDAANATGDALNDAAQATENAASNAAQATEKAYEDAAEATKNAADNAAAATENAAENTAQATENAYDNAAEATENAAENAAAATDQAVNEVQAEVNAMDLDVFDPAQMIRTRDITGGPVYTVDTANGVASFGTQTYDMVGEGWDEIGEIEDVVLSKSGQMMGVVIEIGGFLDIGDKHVYLPLDNVQLVPVDDKSYAIAIGQSEEQLEQMEDIDEGFWN